MHSCSINGKYFDWILISRRSCFRAGVRYYVRGRINFMLQFCLISVTTECFVLTVI